MCIFIHTIYIYVQYLYAHMCIHTLTLCLFSMMICPIAFSVRFKLGEFTSCSRVPGLGDPNLEILRSWLELNFNIPYMYIFFPIWRNIIILDVDDTYMQYLVVQMHPEHNI